MKYSGVVLSILIPALSIIPPSPAVLVCLCVFFLSELHRRRRIPVCVDIVNDYRNILWLKRAVSADTLFLKKRRFTRTPARQVGETAVFSTG
jgi:hypothetical protein